MRVPEEGAAQMEGAEGHGREWMVADGGKTLPHFYLNPCQLGLNTGFRQDLLRRDSDGICSGCTPDGGLEGACERRRGGHEPRDGTGRGV